MKSVILMLVASATTAAAPAQETISLASTEWSGSPIQWSIRPDGSIAYTRDPRDLIIVLPLRMETRKSGAAPERYRQIAALLAPAYGASQPAHCRKYVTEGQQGVVHWGSGHSLRYDNGCLDPDAKRVEQSIAAAQKQIAAWMKDAPVAETRDVTTSAEVRRYDP